MDINSFKINYILFVVKKKIYICVNFKNITNYDGVLFILLLLLLNTVLIKYSGKLYYICIERF